MSFTEDDDFQMPELESRSEEHASVEEKRAARRQAAQGALAKWFAANPNHGLDIAGYSPEHAMALIQTVGDVIGRTHTQNPDTVVFFDRQSGQYVSPADAVNRVLKTMPSFGTSAWQAAQAAKRDLGIGDDNGNDGGASGAPAAVTLPAGKAPSGPSAKHIAGFEIDHVLQSPEVNRARAACLQYFREDGSIRSDPMTDDRFKSLLFAAQPSGFASGTVISELSNRFQAERRDAFARKVSPDALAKLSDTDWAALTRAQKTVIVSRFGLDGWENVLATRTKAAMRQNQRDVDELAAKYPNDDEFTLYYVRSRGLAIESARTLAEGDRRRGRRLSGS